jgi:hypothetical protein
MGNRFFHSFFQTLEICWTNNPFIAVYILVKSLDADYFLKTQPIIPQSGAFLQEGEMLFFIELIG